MSYLFMAPWSAATLAAADLRWSSYRWRIIFRGPESNLVIMFYLIWINFAETLHQNKNHGMKLYYYNIGQESWKRLVNCTCMLLRLKTICRQIARKGPCCKCGGPCEGRTQVCVCASSLLSSFKKARNSSSEGRGRQYREALFHYAIYLESISRCSCPLPWPVWRLPCMIGRKQGIS